MFPQFLNDKDPKERELGLLYGLALLKCCYEVWCFGTDISAGMKQEIEEAYEENTGKVIVRTFEEYGIDPDAVPAVLVKQHGPFTWGPSPKKAVENAKILEVVAEMNYHALQLTRADIRVPQFLLDKHYYRKHGANAYYGQNNAKSKSGATHK